jgi:hypothetical protein
VNIKNTNRRKLRNSLSPFKHYTRSTAIVVTLLAILGAPACSARRTISHPLAPTPVGGPDYADLQPGWRLQIVTPVGEAPRVILPESKSGSGTPGVPITAKVEGSFTYEVAVYTIEHRRGGGVRVRLASAELIRDGNPAKESRTSRPLFVLPEHVRHVRLLFLTRASEADHDMAVIASDRAGRLDALTSMVKMQGIEGCNKEPRAHCSWIPRGVAVRPQLQKAKSGPWIPVR